MGNYDGSLVETGFSFEGYTDNYNCTSKDLTRDGGDQIIQGRQYGRYTVSGKKTYEFALIPNMGFLGSPDLLVKNCELKLSFDRAQSSVAILKMREPNENIPNVIFIQ